MNEHLEIIEIFRDVVSKLPDALEIMYPGSGGGFRTVSFPKVHYLFGSSQYVKDELDLYCKAQSQSEQKFPLVALFTPVTEERGLADYFSKAKVSLIIASSSRREWSNEQREVFSFKCVLRPIYRRLLEVLREEERFDWGYDESIRHTYSENYDYGRYGAYTQSGEAVSEPIDAINIRSLELKINYPNCR